MRNKVVPQEITAEGLANGSELLKESAHVHISYNAPIEKDLWPTLSMLEHHGLLFDRGGTHTTEWTKVLETLAIIKSEPTQNMSTISTQQACRTITLLALAEEPFYIKLNELLKISKALDKSVEELGKKTNLASDSNATDNPLLQLQEEMQEAVQQFSHMTARARNRSRTASRNSDLSRNRYSLQSVQHLKVNFSNVEDELMQILAQMLQRSGANSLEPNRYALPISSSGKNPLHVCLAMGLTSTAKKIIERFYPTPELLSQQAVNDWEPFRIRQSKVDQWEDGMSTGETVLHIAIARDDVELVEYLLARNISLVSRARGLFFQPAMIPRRAQDLSKSERRRALRLGINLYGGEGYFPFAFDRNELSGCYYGEFPLSFAACMGNLSICDALYTEAKNRHLQAGERGMLRCERAERDQQIARRERMAQVYKDGKCRGWEHAADAAAPGAQEGERHSRLCVDLQLWLNAMDMFGNTACHMAAMHGRADVIDWLMTKEEARESLEMLNMEGFTPFTLAVRLGNVDLADHLLKRHLSRIGWTYGRVLMERTDLFQVDMYRVEGHPLHSDRRYRSALEVIVEYGVAKFADHRIIFMLFQDKWDKFARRMHVQRVVMPYLALTTCLLLYAALRGLEIRRDWSAVGPDDPGPSCTWDMPAWAFGGGGKGGGGQGPSELAAAALALQVWVVVVGAPALVVKAWAERPVGAMADLDADKDGSITLGELASFTQRNGDVIVDAFGAGLLVLTGVFRLVCDDRSELNAAAAACVVIVCGLLNLLAPFHFFRGLMSAVARMLRGDVTQFLSVYLVMHMAFALSRFLLLQRGAAASLAGDGAAAARAVEDGAAQTGFLDAMLTPMWVYLGNGLGDIMYYYGNTGSAGMTITAYAVWVILSNVLMLNLLIAMLARTFEEEERGARDRWFLQWAELILRCERRLSPAERRRLRSGKPSNVAMAGERPEEDRYSVITTTELSPDDPAWAHAAGGQHHKAHPGAAAGRGGGESAAALDAIRAARRAVREGRQRMAAAVRMELRAARDRIGGPVKALLSRLRAVESALRAAAAGPGTLRPAPGDGGNAGVPPAGGAAAAVEEWARSAAGA